MGEAACYFICAYWQHRSKPTQITIGADRNLSDWQLNSILPVRYWPEPKDTKYDQVVIVNWLQIEVDMSATKKMPVLEIISGWRNREVWQWVQDHIDLLYAEWYESQRGYV